METELSELKYISALLEKILLFQLRDLDLSQGQIAKIIGKSKTWVNSQLKGLPQRDK
jgi:hypothetical protein